MDAALQLVTLGVADLAVSRRFYSEALGWQPILDLPGEIVFYQVGRGLVLGLFPLEQLGADAGAPATPGSPMSLAQILPTREAVDAAVERARTAGARVLKEPQVAAFGGYHSYVADPDGHRWEISHNPGWVEAPDGSVTIGPILAP